MVGGHLVLRPFHRSDCTMLVEHIPTSDTAPQWSKASAQQLKKEDAQRPPVHSHRVTSAIPTAASATSPALFFATSRLHHTHSKATSRADAGRCDQFWCKIVWRAAGREGLADADLPGLRARHTAQQCSSHDARTKDTKPKSWKRLATDCLRETHVCELYTASVVQEEVLLQSKSKKNVNSHSRPSLFCEV